jgi:outer membrane immunogenic protein
MKTCMVALLSLAMTGTSGAFDQFAPSSPLRSGYDWSGAYIGGHFGYGWGGATNDWFDTGIPAAWVPDGDIAYGSVTGGVLFGYQQQFASLVAGVEADFSLAHFSGDDAQFAGLVNTIEINALGSLRGRLGWAHDNLLVFGTGGLTAASFRKGGEGSPAVNSQLALGWTAGFGVELALTEAWRIRTEYLHTRLGDVETNLGYLHRANAPTINVLRVGANYRF